MNKPIPISLSRLKASARRRKLLSALVAGILFIVGLPGMSIAAPGKSPAPGKPHSGTYTYSVSIVKDYSVAGSGNPDIIEISVNPIPNPVENLTFNISGFTYTPVQTTDPVTGKVTLSFSSSTVGPVTIQVFDPSSTTIPVITQVLNFIAAPGPPDPAKSYLQVVTGSVTANGTSQDVVQAVLYDSHGNLVSDNTPVNFVTMPGGTATLSSNGLTTAGIATAVLTSTVAGSVQVQGFINGTPLTGTPLIDQANPANNYVTVLFTVGTPDPAHSELVVDVGSTTADGVSTDKIHAIIRDANGNPEPAGTSVTLTFNPTGTGPIDGTAVLSSSSETVTLLAGGVTPPITITNTKTGTVQIVATVNGQPITVNSPAPVNFVSGPPDLSKSSLVVDVSSTADDGTSIDQIHAHLVDANGNLVNIPTTIQFIFSPTGSIDGTAGLSVTTPGGGPGGGAYTVTPNATGDITLTITNTQVGSVSLGALVNGAALSNGSPAVVKFVDPTEPDPTNPQTQLIVDVPSTTADGVSTDQIHVHLVAVNGLPVTKPVTVVFNIFPSGAADATATGTETTSTPSQAGFGPYAVKVTPDINGNITLTIADITVGSVSFGVTVDGITITNGSPAIVNFVTGAPVPGDPGGSGGTPGGSDPGGGGPGAPGASGYTVEFVVWDHRLADGTQKDSVAAYVTDANKHPVTGADIQFSIQTLPAAGTATANAQFVGGPDVLSNNGYCGIAITSTKPGTVYIVATLNGVPLDNSYRLITFDDAPDVNNPETYIKTIIYEALADGTQQTEVKVHVVSLDGSVMSGQEIKFSIDSGAAQIVTPGPWITDANGDAYIFLTSKTPGDVKVTATVDDLLITNGSPARLKFALINIYVPKVFTPNGDGTNDVLKPILVGIQTFHYFSVYNRWGNLVFTTQDPNQGWDGTFRGVPQPVETYLWIAEGITVEGKKIVQKGMTSLVK